MIPVSNIPEQYLYNLLPQGVIDLDSRRLIEAVLSGYQDRLSDLRSYVSGVAQLNNPDSGFPQTGLNVVLVTFTGPVGQVVTRSLDILPDTPDLDDVTELTTWAAGQLQLPDGQQVISAVAGTDILRTVSIDSLSLLAENLGATIYPGIRDGESAEEAAATRRRLVESYFPNLRLKGTAAGFSVLGRALGFDDVVMTPLWSRLLPHLPSDPGNIANAGDFSAKPDQLPAADLPDERYDPTDYTDGIYHTWVSGQLSEDPDDHNFWTSVSKTNPFIVVSKVDSSGTVNRPVPGEYVLAGGAPNATASVTLNRGTNVSNLLASAVVAGPAFNGLKVEVVDFYGTASGLEVTGQLSSRKYRSSYFDLKATLARVSTAPIEASPDLAVNPSLAPDGTATAPFLPWSGGTVSQSVSVFPSVSIGPGTVVSARVQASGTNVQLDRSIFDTALSVIDYLEDQRPATRRVRSKTVGLSVRDHAGYAASPSSSALFTASGTGTYTGTISTVDLPAAPRSVYLQAFVNSNPVATYADQLSATLVGVAGDGFSGSFNEQSSIFNVVVGSGTFSQGGRLVAEFVALQGTSVRAEPSWAKKQGGLASYGSNPEDQVCLSGSNVSLYDEVPWRRELLQAGAPVDTDFYTPAVPDLSLVPSPAPYKVQSTSGRLYELDVLDVDSPVPYRFKVIEDSDLDPVTGEGTTIVDRVLMAEDANRLRYPVVLIDDIVVSSAYWSDAKVSGMVHWIPFNEHPLDKLDPYDRRQADVSADVKDYNRVWDPSRGWNLLIGNGDSVTVNNPSPLGSTASLSIWVKPGTPSGSGESRLLTLGNGTTYLTLSSVSTVSLWWSVLGIPTKIAYATISPGSWSMISVVRGGSSISFGTGTPSTAVAWQNFSTVNLDPLLTSRILVQATDHPCQVHDLTVWNVAKTTSQVEAIRAANPASSSVQYQTTFVTSEFGDSRYIFKLLASGFAYPSSSDVMTVRDEPAFAQRYDSQAVYRADDRFKQVGLGDGILLRGTYQLGLRGVQLSGDGKILVSGSYAPLPGFDTTWGTGTGAFNVVVQPFNSAGGTDLLVTSSTATPWPNNVLGNSAQDRAYVKGDDGKVYEVYVDDLGSGPVLAARSTVRSSPHDQPTDACSLLSSPGHRLSVKLSGSYVPYEIVDAAMTFSTPPLYLYRQSKVYVEALSGAYPRWSNPNSFGQGINTAALQDDGRINFVNSETLTPGTYQVTVDAGNVGSLDDGFDGYAVNVSITTSSGSVVSARSEVLLPTGSNSNPRGQTVFNVSVPVSVSGPWILSFNWSNGLTIPRKGQARQLAIYGYELRLISPSLYAVSLDPLTLTPVNVSDTSSVRPGGLVATINSFGTVVEIDHEASIYPDGSAWPLSNLLTTSTNTRREVVRISNPSLSVDPVVPTQPIVTGLSTFDGLQYYNVGSTVPLSGTTSSSGSVSAYVWRFWDNTVETTTVPTFSKVVTPGLTADFQGTVSLTAVDLIGRSSTQSIFIPINRPPTICLSADRTSGIFPYTATVTATVNDFDGNTVEVDWYVGSTLIGTNLLSLSYTAKAPVTLTAIATDISRGAVSSSSISLDGVLVSNPQVSPIICDGAGRVSSSNSMEFSVYAVDARLGGSLAFKWRFWDSSIPGLFPSGVSDRYLPLQGNSKDYHWSIVNSSSSSDYLGTAYTFIGDPSQLVTPSSGVDGLSQMRPVGWYDYQIGFDLHSGLDMSTISITGTGQACNRADIYVNGILVAGQTLSLGGASSFSLTGASYQSGLNTITFRVYVESPVTPSPAWLRIASLSGSASFIGTTTSVVGSPVKFNTVTKTLAHAPSGEQAVSVTVTSSDGNTATASTLVNMVTNTAPTIVSVKTPSSGVLVGGIADFVAQASSQAGDTLGYTWNFTSPRPLTLYGGTVGYQTIMADLGKTVTGTLVVDDGNGGTATAAIPPVVVSATALAPLQVSVAPGYYPSGFIQSIVSTDTDVTVRYTLDGTDITSVADGILYQNPFAISVHGGVGSITMKARGFSSSSAPTAQTSFDFTFYNPTSSAPRSLLSAANVTLVTVNAAGDSVIGTSDVVPIPGDDQAVSLAPTSTPQVNLSNEPVLPFSPVSVTRNQGSTKSQSGSFVKLVTPI